MKIKKWPNKVRRFFSINKKQLKKDGGSTDGPGSELDQQHASKKKQLAWTPDDIFDEFHGTSPIPPEMKGYVLLVEVGGGEVDQGWVLDYSGTSGSGDEVVVARYDLPQSRIKGKKAPSSPPPGMYNTYDLKTLPWIWYKDLKVFNKIETGKLSDMVAFVTGRIAVAGEMKPWEGLDASWKEAKDRVTEKRKLGGGGAGDNDGGEEEEEEEEEEETEEERKAREEALRKAKEEKRLREEERKAEEEKKKKPLTKKEKQALKAKEMDEIDDLLNQFGVSAEGDTATSKPEEKEKEETGVQEGTSKSKKKRKNRKKKNGATNDDDKAEATSTEEASGVSEAVNVAAVLKAKAKVTKKSAAEIASSTAAKEAKAKKQAAADKKKKKKKDKYAHGAPSR